nr:cellulose synthase-like protein H1 [Ipomoea batatas]
MAAKHPPFPLHEIKLRNNRISRTIEIIILFLLLSLITYRLFSLHSHDRIPWLLALICESWFTFVWILTINCKWNQIQTKTYPQRLLQWLGDGTSEFPAVDMFVTTADPELEPPIITVNTVLSLLAVDYPANKLACYVSDDGASPLTFYSLVQASKFAQLWVPFCKKYNIADEYSKLCEKIEEASEESISYELIDEFSVFTNIDRRDHPAIIKVIWENKGSVDNGDGVPHLVYISREKRPKYPHHYKAGAMNVLPKDPFSGMKSMTTTFVSTATKYSFTKDTKLEFLPEIKVRLIHIVVLERKGAEMESNENIPRNSLDRVVKALRKESGSSVELGVIQIAIDRGSGGLNTRRTESYIVSRG